MMRTACFSAIGCVLFVATLAAVDSEKAVYMGGTITTVKAKAEGTFATTHPELAQFATKKDGTLDIPYKAIKELEYGQKVGRRVKTGILVSPLALFSKARAHYLTITYTDDGAAEQAVVFELGKNIVRTTLKVLETRSGKPIIFQDEEAKKSLGGK